MALIGAAALDGCGTTAPLPALDSGPPIHWRHLTGAPENPPVDLFGWWKAFNDPLLDNLVEQALTANPNVNMALERLLGERALYGRRQAPNLPQLNVRTSDQIDPDASASYFVVGFDATWELGLFGRARAVDRIAAGQLGDAAASLQEARVSLVAEVVRTYIELRAAQQSEKLLADAVDARRRLARLEDVRIRLKLDPPAERWRADADVSEALARLGDPRAAADRAAQSLALLLGHAEPDAAWLKPGKLPILGSPGPIVAPSGLLRTRPEIVQAESRVLSAAGELGIAHADLYPRLGLGASLLWSTNIATNRRLGGTDSIGALGPQIDIPLFDWGMRKARENAKSHDLRAAVLAYRQAVLSAVAEVENALGNLQQQQSLAQAREQASTDSQNILDTQRTRRQLGLASEIDLAEGELSNLEAKLQLVAAYRDGDIAYLALYKALGGAPPLDAGVAASSCARGNAS